MLRLWLSLAFLFMAAPAQTQQAQQATATFAGGCFWCVEADFDKVDGVISTTSGYMGGSAEKATYKQVSAGGTGHVEVVRIVYDPAKVSYEKLLDVFWRNIDPLDAGGQFCDRGDSYRTGIFVHGEEQRRLAEQSKQALADSKRLAQPIVTEIVDAGPFYPAEDYHQDYLTLHPNQPYIVFNDVPKIENLKKIFAENYVEQPTLVRNAKATN